MREAREAFGHGLGPVVEFFEQYKVRWVNADSVIKDMETYLAAREPPVAEGQRAMVARVLEKSRDRANPVRR
eukprot:3831071-Rhodomonas_salina.1